MILITKGQLRSCRIDRPVLFRMVSAETGGKAGLARFVPERLALDYLSSAEYNKQRLDRTNHLAYTQASGGSYCGCGYKKKRG